jgi:hypothetical protein
MVLIISRSPHHASVPISAGGSILGFVHRSQECHGVCRARTLHRPSPTGRERAMAIAAWIAFQENMVYMPRNVDAIVRCELMYESSASHGTICADAARARSTRRLLPQRARPRDARHGRRFTPATSQQTSRCHGRHATAKLYTPKLRCPAAASDDMRTAVAKTSPSAPGSTTR